MARIIEIKVEGVDAGYTAMVNRITESNNRMTRDATAGAQKTVLSFRQVEQAGAAVGNTIRTLLTGFVALQAINFVRQFSEFAEQLGAVSKRTGIAVSQLSALKGVADINEASFEDLTSGFRFLSKSIADSSDATSDQAKVFKALNVDAKGIIGSGGTLVDVMAKLADGFKDNLNETDRFKASQVLLGRSSEGLINILSLGSDEFRRQIAEQLKLGSITKETSTKADELRDSWSNLTKVLQTEIGTRAINFLAEFIPQLQEAPSAIGRTIDFLDRLNTKVGDVGQSFRDSLVDMKNFLKNLPNLKFDLGTLSFSSPSRLPSGSDRDADLRSRPTPLEELSSHTPVPTKPKVDLGAVLAADKANQAAKAAADLINREAEAQARLREQIAQTTQKITEQSQQHGDLEANVRGAALATIEQEHATAELGFKHNNILTPAISRLLLELKKLKISLFDVNEEERKRQEMIKRTEEFNRFLIESEGAETVAQETARAEIEQEFALKQRLLDLDIDLLHAKGLTAEADRKELENLIQLNSERKRALETAAQEGRIGRVPGEIAAISKSTDAATERMRHLGEVTINIGQTIANSVGDAFEGIILGTSKLADVGKNLFAALVRDVAQFFTDAMVKKLGFEKLVFSNLHGFVPAAQAALASGDTSGGGIFGNLFGGGGGSGGGIGGFLSNILGDFGRPGGVSGPLLENGNFLSGSGSGFGGIFGNIGSSITGLFGTSGQGSGLGAIGKFFTDIFGGQSALGSAGGPLLGGLGSLLLSAFTGGFSKSKIGGTLGQAAGAGIGSIFGPIGTLLGGFIGNMIGSLFNQVPNPTAILRAQFSGIFFDAIESVFKPGSVSVGKISSQDIGKGKVGEIRTAVQTALETASQQWTDILNLFPETARKKIIPTLDAANANLSNAFARLKFTEGGSRNIEQELKDFQGRESARGFFHALRTPIGVGLRETLSAAGLPDIGELAFQQFSRGVRLRSGQNVGGVFEFPDQTNDSAEKALKAIADVVGLTSGLAGVSRRGVTPFLTGADTQFLGGALTNLFSGSSGDAFTKNAEALKEKLAPITDFLKNAVAESTSLFGRGIIAALEAADASQAKQAFLQGMGDGIKDIIFNGITEAFISSAQFNDLLAPLQRTIRDFTQQAIASGQTPDLGAFRAAILPLIGDLSTRAEILAPLLEALNGLGFDFKEALKVFSSGGGGGNEITININGFNGDVHDLATELDNKLRALGIGV